ncbi:MAG: FecR domain-containing protein [Bdellovibrionales bacterium]|nr:FecR domain-containing protein [Bdellovibrionales bacterium]
MIEKVSRTERAILLIACSLLVIFSYLLFDDSLLVSRTTSNSEKALGEIYFVQNDVRRKSEGDFSWLPSVTKEKVFASDSLFTGDNSEASIELGDGTIVHIKPNSLIALSMKQGQLELNLKYGDLVSEVNKSSELVIRSGGEEYQLKGSSSPKKGSSPGSQASSVLVRRSRSGRNEVHSLKGAPQVISRKTGLVMTLKPTVPTPLTPDLKVPSLPTQPLVLEKPKATILFKTADRLIFSRKSSLESQLLEWRSQGVDSKDQFVIEVKEKPDDPVNKAREKTKKEQLTLMTPLKDGSYVWRVLLEDSKGTALVQTDFQSFKVVTMTPPEWILPKLDPTNPTTVIPNKLATLDMQWSSSSPVLFEWQLSTAENFQTILEQGMTDSSGIVSLKKPAPGGYWARARAKLTTEPEEILWTPWSSVAELTIAAPALTSLPAPILIKRKIEVIVSALATRSPASIPPAKISWREVGAADSYTVEVSENPDFSSSKKFKTKSLNHSFNQYTHPRHYVRVIAQAKSGLQSPPSSLGEIILGIPRPQLNAIPNRLAKSDNPEAKAPEQSLLANWTPVFLANRYNLEISKNEKFQNPQVFESKSPEAPFRIKEPGTYYARVKPWGASDVSITAPSNVVRFEYTFTSTLRTPTLAEPLNQATVFLQQDLEPFIWLEWKKDPAAIKYEIQVSNDPHFKKVLLTSTTENHRFLLKQKIPYGSVFWRVRSIAKFTDLTSQWSTSRVFTLVYKKNEVLVE